MARKNCDNRCLPYSYQWVGTSALPAASLGAIVEALNACGCSCWFDFTEEEGERLVDEAVDAYAVTYHHTVLFDSARNAYIVRRIKRILKRTVSAMQYQLKKRLCAGEVRGFVFGAGGVGCGQYRAF